MQGNERYLPKVRITSFGVVNAAYVGNKPRQYVPHNIRQSSTLSIFTTRNKHWKFDRCSCTLCKSNIKCVGFLIYSLYLAILSYVFILLFSTLSLYLFTFCKVGCNLAICVFCKPTLTKMIMIDNSDD